MRRVSALRIAMWSGPRNISTALMRSFESRMDTVVWDEPFYGAFLSETGIEHPMREDIIAGMDSDWESVAAKAVGPIPGGKSIYYQKHMTHHLLDSMRRDWMDGVINCFLIRDPAEVIASYALKRDSVTLTDIGMVQQAEIFNYVRDRTGETPPVLDARDVLTDPGTALNLLCRAVGIDFDDAMLNWPAGPRDSDGVWAKHWYHSVEASTGFATHTPRETNLTGELQDLAEACEPHYRALYDLRLTAS